uniref:Uncharacterized protein n=1 Tax=Rhizophora mucronata TaxID=61149 RepID=A0A2P2LRZ8_RHIMU
MCYISQQNFSSNINMPVMLTNFSNKELPSYLLHFPVRS